MKQLFAFLLLAASASGAVRGSLFFVEQDERIERLQKEKANLITQSDPVGRTKTQIKIANLLLTLVSDAVKSAKTDVIEMRLQEYVAAIQDANQTMKKTGRDARKKSGGFKELEIALRRQIRQLDDIGSSISYDQREPIEKAKEQAGNIRDELLKALFGSQNAPSRKS